MTLLYSLELNSDISSASSLFAEMKCLKVVTPGFVFDFLDGRHHQNALLMLQEEGGHPERDSHLCVSLTMAKMELRSCKRKLSS